MASVSVLFSPIVLFPSPPQSSLLMQISRAQILYLYQCDQEPELTSIPSIPALNCFQILEISGKWVALTKLVCLSSNCVKPLKSSMQVPTSFWGFIQCVRLRGTLQITYDLVHGTFRKHLGDKHSSGLSLYEAYKRHFRRYQVDTAVQIPKSSLFLPTVEKLKLYGLPHKQCTTIAFSECWSTSVECIYMQHSIYVLLCQNSIFPPPKQSQCC